jgi:hypothetical protein
VIILAFLLGGIVAIASAVVWRALQWLEDQRKRHPAIVFSTYPLLPDESLSALKSAAEQAVAHAESPAMKQHIQALVAAHQASAYGQPPHGPATLAHLSPQRLASDLRSDWRPERN